MLLSFTSDETSQKSLWGAGKFPKWAKKWGQIQDFHYRLLLFSRAIDAQYRSCVVFEKQLMLPAAGTEAMKTVKKDPAVYTVLFAVYAHMCAHTVPLDYILFADICVC